MPGRVAERTKQRAPCAVTIDGRRHNGLLLDVSQTGLFVQTSARAEPGTRIDLELVVEGKTVAMQGEVARRKQVPPQLLTVAQGGIGVRILSAPEEYYQLLAQVQGAGVTVGGLKTAPKASTKRQTGADASGASFDVRVKLGPRIRTLRVQCADEAAARRKVQEDLGEEWKILEVAPVS